MSLHNIFFVICYNKKMKKKIKNKLVSTATKKIFEEKNLKIYLCIYKDQKKGTNGWMDTGIIKKLKLKKTDRRMDE